MAPAGSSAMGLATGCDPAGEIALDLLWERAVVHPETHMCACTSFQPWFHIPVFQTPHS